MEVIVQQWSQVKKCQYYMYMAHLFAFTIGGTLHRCHCWRTNQQSISVCYNSTIVVQPVTLQVTNVPVMWHVVIFLSSTIVLTPNGQFFSCAPVAVSERYVHTTLYFYPCLQFLQPAAGWLHVCLASHCVLLPFCTRNCCVRVTVIVVLGR
jgi:hypothetical protein